MSQGIGATGTVSMEELERSPGFPGEARLRRGAVAVIECVQEIPCDVCGSACPFGAITLASISSLPKLDEDRCTGCGTCIPSCPGLAIFLVDLNYSKDVALVSFPYELLPVPEIGSTVKVTDRLGRSITTGKVMRVVEREGCDRTLVVSVAVLKEYAQRVRGIAPRGKG
jgi:ferredoxin